MDTSIESIEMNDMPAVDADHGLPARIIVIGVGGAGCNSINRMIDAGVRGVNLIAANTDIQSLGNSRAPVKIGMGMSLTRGLGCGGNPEVGREAALAEAERILDLLKGADLVFITGGEGGGTFTGAAPVIARLALESGALTIATATMPFRFQGKKRLAYAEAGIQELKDAAHALIVVENENLLHSMGENALLEDSFCLADDALCQSIRGISEVITEPGIINIDLADVRTVMQHKGMVLIGRGIAQGENRVLEAAQFAISNPLQKQMPISGAKAVLLSIAGSRHSLKLHEVHAAAEIIGRKVETEELILGAVYDESLQDKIQVTVVATGLIEEEAAIPQPAAEPEVNQEIRVQPAPQPPWEKLLERPAFLRRRAG